MNREQAFLLVVVAVGGLASLLVLLPFLEYVLAALLLGYVLRPLHRRVSPYLGDRVAAVAVIAGAGVAVLAPLAYVGVVLYDDLQDLATGETSFDETAVEDALYDLTGEEVDVGEVSGEAGQFALDVVFGSVPQLVTFATTLVLGVTLVLFLVYYVLVDGPAFVQWAIHTAPMNDAVAHRLACKADRMTWGVVVGHLFVALVQGLLGGLGLYVAGVPSPVFWTFVMIVTALLPVVGAFLVWGPAAAYLFVVGNTDAALFLTVWGLLVVSLVDNYLRSIVIDQSAHVNPGIILVGVIGGIYTFGFVGLFVGPIVIGLFAASIQAFDEYYDALSYDTPPPAPPEEGRLSWIEIDSDCEKHADPPTGEGDPAE